MRLSEELKKKISQKKRETYISSIQKGKTLSLPEVRDLEQIYRNDYVKIVLETDFEMNKILDKARWTVQTSRFEKTRQMQEIRSV